MTGAPVLALFAEAESNFESYEMQSWYVETVQKLKQASRRREDRQILAKWDTWVQTLYTEAAKEVSHRR